MGRKIPGRKHRGVRDPEKQAAERFSKIKDKVNTAPSNPDDQQIPASLSRFIDLKNKTKQGHYNKRNRKKLGEERANKIKLRKAKENPIPKFERLPGESDREFKHRMNRICNEVIREAAFEDKYKVDIKRNEEGEVEKVVKRPKDELEVLIKQAKKDQKSKKGKKKKKASKDEEQKVRLTKSQKWALKKAEKKKNKVSQLEEDFSFEPQKENLKFGEIVHAPPTLVTPKKVTKEQGAARPGQKPLLLKSMLPEVKKPVPIAKKSAISDKSKTINKKGKRKDLPNALRRQLDTQQKEIIEAYKLLKAQKSST